MRKSVRYELVTRAIVQALVDQDEAQNISVQHDIPDLPGKFLKHQVDVYWKFEIAGIEYSTVVECKHWNKRLKQETLLAFKAKLDDLKNPTGVMVTRTGFQRGALKYAEAHGILLYVLFEEPPRSPIVVTEGSFGKIEVKFQAAAKGAPPRFVAKWTHFEPEYNDNKYYLDEEWFEDQTRRFGEDFKDEIRHYKLPEQPLSSTKLYDETHAEIGNMLDVFKKKSEEMFKLKVTTDRFIHKFPDATFLKTDLLSVQYFKVTAVSTNITIIEHEPIERDMKIKGIVNFILRNLQDATEQVIPVKESQLQSKA